MTPHDFPAIHVRDGRNAQHYRRAAVNWVRWTRSAVGSPAPLVGAVGRVCDVDHRSDVSQRDAVRVQIGVDVVGDLLWRPTPAEIVADEVGHTDEGFVMSWRPGDSDAAQLSEVSVVNGVGSRGRGISYQGGANHHGDG
jgi:hypothetical protein